MIKQMLTVAKQEVKSLVDHPTAYVLAIAFLGVSLFLTFRNMYGMGVATLRPFFDLLPVLFAVLIPAITMRSLAEEEKEHTLGWLLAQPVNEWGVVLGKFLGTWVFVLLVLAGTLPTAIGVLLLSDADPGIMVAQYLGAAFLAAEFTAIGLWASSITRNQITSFIVAAVISFVLFLVGLPGIQVGVPPIVAGALGRLSVLTHFGNVARGVVDLRDVIYFLSGAGLFLVLAVTAVSGARLARGRADSKRLRTGTAAIAVIVVVVNLLGGQIHGRLDLTRGGLFTLSGGTREILGNLNDLVHVTLFASSELPPEVQLELRDVRDLLSDMKGASDGNLSVTEVDPDDSEDAAAQASSYGIQQVEFNVMRNDEFEVRRGYYGLVATYADDREVFPVIDRTDDLEFRLASAISRMTATSKKTVLFVTDAGAKSSTAIPGIQQVLGERYNLRALSLTNDTLAAPSPDSFAVMVVAAPTGPMDSVAVRNVRSYVDAGGPALLMLDPVEVDPQSGQPIPIHTGLEPLLADRGVRVADSVVVDLSSAERVALGQQGPFSVIASYPLWPIVQPAGDNIVTRGMSGLTLGWAGALEITDSSQATPLWVTTEAGGVRDASMSILPQQDFASPEDQTGVRVVAAAIDTPPDSASATGPPGRIVVIADGTFAEQEFVQSNPQNLVFVANAIDWLAEDEALIRIRSKDRTPPNLVFTSDTTQDLLKWGNLAGMPLLFALAGLFRVTGRRRRAERRWKEVVEP
jgi:ABC-2 type transport system permease protein